MDCGKGSQVEWRTKGISLDEPERISWLRLDVHADALEACPMVADRTTAGSAEQVE